MDLSRAARAAVFGALAYLVGYALVYVLLLTEDGTSWDLLREAIGEVGLAGWIFYEIHFVGLTAESPGFFESTVSIFDEVSTDIPRLVYRLIPAITLIIAGGLAAWFDVPTSLDELREAATDGAFVVLGYAPLAIIGAFLFTYDEDAVFVEVSLGPDIGAALVLMAIVYPLILGTLGGVLFHLVSEET